MSESEALTILLRAHREMEEHLSQASGWASRLPSGGTTLMDQLQSDLQGFGRAVSQDLALHIAHEDNALFPVLENKIGRDGPIAVMLYEHRELERLTEQYHSGLAGRNPGLVTEAIQGIVRVLTGHIDKEENVLFPMAQNILGPAEWQEVLERMKAQKV